MSHRILCLWFPNWPMQRLLAARPELVGRAVVLYCSERGGRCLVAACSAAAARWGIAVGMPLVEARSLVGHAAKRMPAGELLWLEHDAAADREALRQLARDCHRFAPRVGIGEGDAPESLLLDVTGAVDWWGGEEVLGEAVGRELAERGFRFRAAFAPTVGMAWAMARYGDAAATPCDGDGCDGDGCDGVDTASRIVRAATIGALPIEALRLSAETVGMLVRLGIRHIDPLVRLPRSELQARFGSRLLERIDQFTGKMDEVLIDLPPRQMPVAERALEFPTDRWERIERILEQLLEHILAHAVAPTHGILELACRFDSQDAPAVEETVGLFQPSRSVDHLRQLVQLHQPWRRLRGPIDRLRVTVTRIAPFEWRQKQLFDDGDSAPDTQSFAALLDRLASRLGQAALVGAELACDAQPESAWVRLPLIVRGGSAAGRKRGVPFSAAKRRGRAKRGPRGARTRVRSRQRADRAERDGRGAGKQDNGNRSQETRLSVARTLERPPSLLPRPMAIDPVRADPDGAPRRFYWRGRWYHVARCWGPERIETAWWQTTPVVRDYYRVEVATGHRFWLFQHRPSAQWFLHGMF